MRRRLTLILVVCTLCALAGRSVATMARPRGTGFEIVHYCDPRGDCTTSHGALEHGRGEVPVRIAATAESAQAAMALEFTSLPATVLFRDGVPVGAMVGQSRPAVLRRTLAELGERVRAGTMPRATAEAPLPAQPDTGLVVVVEVANTGGRVQIVSTEVIEGAAPKPYTRRLDSHRVQLLGEDGSVLVSRAWQPLIIAAPPPPLPGQEAAPGQPAEVVVSRTAFVLPFHPEARRVRIEQPFGLEAASATIDRRQAARPEASARAATPIHMTGPDSERLVVLIIGDAYKRKDKKRFPDDAQTIADFWLGGEPISGSVNDINVYRSSTIKGLKCKYQLAADGKDSRLLVCNYAKVIKKAARDRIAYDELLVLVNNEKYGGSGHRAVGGGGPETFATSYNRIGWEPGAASYGWGPEVSVHEMGHSFLGLMDEYEYGTEGTPWGPNCQTPPCTWEGPGLGCHDGCSYNGLSRPTARGCYMNAFDPVFQLCPVGTAQAEMVLARY